MSSTTNEYKSSRVQDAFKQSAGNALYRKQDISSPVDLDTMGTKMVKGEQTRDAIDDKEPVNSAHHDAYLKNSLARSIERIRDNQNILQLLPDIKQSLEIIIGTVMSPKDMSEPTLTFKSTSRVFDDTAATLLNYLKDYFISSYKIQDQLTDILWDVLGRTGAYPQAILPETTIDYMINSNGNVTFEELQNEKIFNAQGQMESMGLLATRKTIGDNSDERSLFEFIKQTSLEGYGDGTAKPHFDGTILTPEFNISVLDNFDALKGPLLKNRISRQVSQTAINHRRRGFTGDMYSSEAYTTTTDSGDYTRTVESKRDLQKLYPERQFKSTPIMRVRGRGLLKKETVGHPFVLKLPTESVIPVFNPTNPKEHIGYYVLLDPVGYPLRLSELDNMYKMLQTASNVTNSSGSGLLSSMLQQSANANSAGTGFDINQLSMHQQVGMAAPIFQQMVERDLLDRIERGYLGAGVKVGELESPCLIMLARALQGKRTQILFLPEELVSYIANDYDEYGLGKTLLDDSKMIAAMRSMNMIVNSVASSKNAITKRVLNVELSAAEKNPQKAAQIVMQEFVKGTHAEYPLSNNPVEQINYLQMAGVQINFADHPRLPNSKVSVDYLDNQYKPVDTGFDDHLKKLHIQATGLSPEIVEGSGAADFATQTVIQNVLTARRINLISKKIMSGVTQYVQLYTYNSQILMDGLIQRIKDNNIRVKDQTGCLLSDEDVATLFLESIDVSLPPADTTKTKEQKESFIEQAEFYEEALKYIFSEEFLTEEDLGTIGNMETIQKTQKFMKAHFMRRWMKENGVLTELFDTLSVGKEGKPLVDFAELKDDYMSNISLSLLPMMKGSLKRSGDNNQQLEKFRETLTNEPVEPGSGGGYGGGTDSFGDGAFADTNNDLSALDTDNTFDQTTDDTIEDLADQDQKTDEDQEENTDE